LLGLLGLELALGTGGGLVLLLELLDLMDAA
jgi:hypothetical protein